MKRGGPLRRTKVLVGNKPLRRLQRLRARSNTNSYRRRPRDFAFMGFVKAQTCMVITLPPFLFIGDAARAAKHKTTPCNGIIEADHQGERGIGQKADDSTCVPMCRLHHHERHNPAAGTFREFNRTEARAWRARAIEITQANYRKR